MTSELLLIKLAATITFTPNPAPARIALIGTAETVYFKQESDITESDDVISIMPGIVLDKISKITTESILFKMCQNYYVSRKLWK